MLLDNSSIFYIFCMQADQLILKLLPDCMIFYGFVLSLVLVGAASMAFPSFGRMLKQVCVVFIVDGIQTERVGRGLYWTHESTTTTYLYSNDMYIFFACLFFQRILLVEDTGTPKWWWTYIGAPPWSISKGGILVLSGFLISLRYLYSASFGILLLDCAIISSLYLPHTAVSYLIGTTTTIIIMASI